MQDDRGKLERFTDTVKVLMVVDGMQENDATAEVPGVGTSGTCSFGPKRLDRRFSCTANALPTWEDNTIYVVGMIRRDLPQ